MCFSCQNLELPLDGERSVVFERGYDPYTQPTDFDLDQSAVSAFLRGDWGYVTLSASVVGADGSTLGAYSLHGIAEWDGSPCAFEDSRAVQWVAEQALGKVSLTA